MKPKHLTIAYNPLAGGGRSEKRFKKWLALLESSPYSLNLIDTSDKDQWSGLLESNLPNDTLLVVAGGDGSLHCTVNGFFNSSGKLPGEMPHMTVFPVGSGNDWARTHGIPFGPEAWIRKIAGGKMVSGKMGKASLRVAGEKTKEVFLINSAGMGITGSIVEELFESRAERERQASYFKLALKKLWKYSYQTFSYSTNQARKMSKPLTLNIGLHETTGGGMRLFPQNAENAHLKCTIIEKQQWYHIPQLAWKLYFGNIATIKRGVNCFSFEKMNIQSEKAIFPLELDGELYRTEEITLTANKNNWKIVIPQ